VQELERRSKSKHDYLVPAKDFKFYTPFDNGDRKVEAVIPGPFNSIVSLPLSRTAHEQVGEFTGIPRAYYQRLLAEAPELLASNVNTWTGRETSKNRLVRELDGGIRAFVSDRYRDLPSYDLFFSSYGVAKEVGAEIQSASLGDDRFELRFVQNDWREVFDYGDVTGPGTARFGGSELVPGIFIKNSETGQGGLQLHPFVYDGVCQNGLLWATELRQVHIGGKLTELGEYVTDSTRELKDKALWAEVSDLTKAVFDRETFKKIVAAYRAGATLELADPIKAVEQVSIRFDFSDEDRQSILNELISPSHDRDAGRTVLGLVNAITQRAQAFDDDPKRRSDVELLAGQFLAKPRELVEIKVR
jgi:hypothetical protein